MAKDKIENVLCPSCGDVSACTAEASCDCECELVFVSPIVAAQLRNSLRIANCLERIADGVEELETALRNGHD